MRIGQLKVIFTLPQQILEGSSGSTRLTGLPQAPLGYVEWYSKLKPAAEKNHLMYKITRPPPHADGSVPGAVIPSYRHQTKLPAYSKIYTRGITGRREVEIRDSFGSGHHILCK